MLVITLRPVNTGVARLISAAYRKFVLLFVGKTESEGKFWERAVAALTKNRFADSESDRLLRHGSR